MDVLQAVTPKNENDTQTVLDKEGNIRTEPRNHGVEAAVLGAILRNNQVYDLISETLKPEHFHASLHQLIYDRIKLLRDKNQEVRPSTLQHILVDETLLKDAGGMEYLYNLVTASITILNIRDYAHIIYDLYTKRQLISLGTDIVNNAYDSDPENTAPQQIEEAESTLYALATTGETANTLKSFADASNVALETINKAFMRDTHVTGIATHFKDMDFKLGGLHPSDLLILAGRPAMGKTALATTIGFNISKAFVPATEEKPQEGGRVLFFSLEMSAEQLAARVISQQANVSGDRIRRGDIDSDEMDSIVTTIADLSRIPFYIDDTPALTIGALRQRARRAKRQYGLDLIIVDYLQLLEAGGKNNQGRTQEVAAITRGLKTLAKELEVPVLALSQLSRQVEQREDKRPQLSDLRESGSIEQDADVVSFVYRAEYYLQNGSSNKHINETEEHFQKRIEDYTEHLEEVRNVAEFIIAKQRHGPVGTIELYFDGEHTTFKDLDRRYGT